MRQRRVNGVDLSYIEQGAGASVVFVHGAWMDLRYWEPQRQAMATQYRFMAYSLRYHGTASWPDEGEHYSARREAPHGADGRFLTPREVIHGRITREGYGWTPREICFTMPLRNRTAYGS